MDTLWVAKKTHSELLDLIEAFERCLWDRQGNDVSKELWEQERLRFLVCPDCCSHAILEGTTKVSTYCIFCGEYVGALNV